MYQLIKQPEDQLRILFRNTAQKTGIHEAIIEKDFWVCLTLDYLFHDCPWKEAFTFKGGTSHGNSAQIRSRMRLTKRQTVVQSNFLQKNCCRY